MTIYDEIREERARQDAKWGGPGHDDEHTPGDWFGYIVQHVAKAVTDNALMQAEAVERFAKYLCQVVRKTDDGAIKRKQLIRIAALAVAAVESMDRKAAK